jgi:hypothetical protein
MWKYIVAILLVLSGFHGGFGDTADVDSIGKIIQKKMKASAIKIHAIEGCMVAKLFFYRDTLTDSLVLYGGIGRAKSGQRDLAKNIAERNTTETFAKLCTGFFRSDSIIGPIKPYSLWSPKGKWFVKNGGEIICLNLIAIGDASVVK